MQLHFNDVDHLKQAGFKGFLSKASLFLDSSMLSDCKGVYLVLNLDTVTPSYLELGTGGFF